MRLPGPSKVKMGFICTEGLKIVPYVLSRTGQSTTKSFQGLAPEIATCYCRIGAWPVTQANNFFDLLIRWRLDSR